MKTINPDTYRIQSLPAAGKSPLTDLRRPVDEISATLIEPRANVLSLGEKTNTGKISVHGHSEAFFRAFAQILDLELPRSPNTGTVNDHCVALWLAPREWLIVLPENAIAEALAELKLGLTGQHAMLVDVSDRWLQISIAGQPVFDVLGRGTSVDLNNSLAAEGDCAQTLLGLVPVIIHRTLDLPVFDIFVDRSYAEFLWHWLQNAGSDFDLQLVDFDRKTDRQSSFQSSS